MKYIPLKVPHRLLSDDDVYIWLEDLKDEDAWYWRDLPDGHYLHLGAEDLIAFRIKFNV